MANNLWKQVEGFSNMGDDDERVMAKQDGETTSVAYSAYGGLKVVELTGIEDFGKFENTEVDFSLVISECGDDWEVAIPAVCDGVSIIVVIDDNSNVSVIPMNESDDVVSVAVPDVETSEEYDSDECADLDEDLLRLFNLV